jgi:dTDP-4-dehydrorhamnose reductase
MLGRQFMDALARRAASPLAKAPPQFAGWDLPELDIGDPQAVRERIAAARPAVVINCAAYTNVDGAEAAEAEAHRVNAEAVGHVAAACAAVDALLVHFSTDYVFDGTAEHPYAEDDPANPQSAYGRTKWAGEEALRRSGARHLLVRTSWLFGPCGRNFVAAILEKARAGERLRVVGDQVGSPTYAADLVIAVEKLLAGGARGTFHFANSGACSWFDFAREILAKADLTVAEEQITTAELGRPAPRPAYSVLATSRYAAAVGETPPPWQDAVRRYLAESAPS